MKEQRILLVSSVALAAPWNGADKNLARLLAMYDTNNKYIVQSDRYESWPEERIRVVRDRTASQFPGLRQKLKAIRFMMQQTRHADLIHLVASIRRPNLLVGPFLRFWRQLSGRPLIHTALAAGDGAVRTANFPGDVTVVVSEYDWERLTIAGVGIVERITPPLNWANLEIKTPPASTSAWLQPGKKAVLYPGHFGRYGGVSECIHAFASLPPTLDDVVLVLACRTFPGQDWSLAAEQAQTLAAGLGVAERVRIIGEVSDMASLIAACTLTVLVPTRMEGKMAIPLVLLESLALGRPVITGSKPPLSEALFGGGLAVKPGDVQELASALACLLADPLLRERLGNNGREAVRQECVPEKAVQKYQQIYAGLNENEY